jgi:hypothetical protein
MGYRAAKQVATFLGASYARDVLKVKIMPAIPEDQTERNAFEAELRAQLNRINRIGLRADLVSRDFAAAQQRKAIVKTLARIEEMNNASR